MTEEQKEEQQKPARRPSFGGLNQQYATVGGTKRSRRQDAQASNAPSERKEEAPEAQTANGSDAPTSEHSSSNRPSSLEAQEVKHQDSQEARVQEVQTSENVAAQAVSGSDAKKAEKPDRKKRTIYLEPDVDRWIRHRIADTEEEISEVVNLAVRYLMNQQR